MPGIVVILSGDEAELVADAARAAGASKRAFCRAAVLDQARTLHGPAGNAAAMLRDIHAAICGGNGNGGAPPHDEAVAALMTLGLTRRDATVKAARARAAGPTADTAEIVRLALKEQAA